MDRRRHPHLEVIREHNSWIPNGVLQDRQEKEMQREEARTLVLGLVLALVARESIQNAPCVLTRRPQRKAVGTCLRRCRIGCLVGTIIAAKESVAAALDTSVAITLYATLKQGKRKLKSIPRRTKTRMLRVEERPRAHLGAKGKELDN